MFALMIYEVHCTLYSTTEIHGDPDTSLWKIFLNELSASASLITSGKLFLESGTEDHNNLMKA